MSHDTSSNSNFGEISAFLKVFYIACQDTYYTNIFNNILHFRCILKHSLTLRAKILGANHIIGNRHYWHKIRNTVKHAKIYFVIKRKRTGKRHVQVSSSLRVFMLKISSPPISVPLDFFCLNVLGRNVSDMY